MFAAAPVKVLRRVKIFTIILSVLGTALSGYSIFVHYKKGADKNYNAYCDISEDISCSKVFTSKWGKGFGFLSALLGEDSPLILSNGVYGLIFYALVIVLGELPYLAAAHIQRAIVAATNLLSVYLAYILFFVLKDKCVVCLSIYAINFLILITCFVRVKNLTSVKSKKKGGKNKDKNGTQQQQQNSSGKKDKKANQSKNAQNHTKTEQNANANKIAQAPNKNTQNENKKSKKSQNVEAVVSNKNTANSKKNLDQNKNIANAKSQQNSNKNAPNANKGSSNKSSANSTKHSKKKN